MSHPGLSDQAGGDVAVLVSGGLDSAVLAVDLLGKFARVFPIYVRFGLRWEEVEHAHLLRFLELSGLERPGLMSLTVLDEPIAQVYGDHWSNAGRPGVPDAQSADEAVFLPGRNLLLAAKAAVWCRLRGIDSLAFGILKGNPFPDSTPGFFHELAGVMNRAMEGRLRILRPYDALTKAEVLRRGIELPIHLTFSCLDPIGDAHCGRCNKCAERRNAFRSLGIEDRTRYADDPDGALPSDTPSRRNAAACTR